MSTSKLIFFPKSIDDIFDQNILVETLVQAQFISIKPIKHKHYLPGDKFLNLITFLGCSPSINLEPIHAEPYCFIQLLKQTPQAEYLGATSHVNPKCPACGKRIAHWKTEQWQQPNENCTCDKCQQQTPYAQLNWKHECGFARCGFEIHHIYPHEAVPTDQLLDLLKQCTGFGWEYCYAV